MQTMPSPIAPSSSPSAAATDAQVICVAPQFLDKVWPHTRRWLERAIDRGHGDYSLDYVYRQLKANKSLLWVAWSKQRGLLAACTTEIVGMLDTNDRVCVITTYGGIMPEPSYLDRIEKYARDEKCVLMRLYGRSGWNRVLRERGYTQPWVAIEKRLRHGRE